jgi:hypothetical protein
MVPALQTHGGLEDRAMFMFLVVVAIFVLSVAIGSAIGSGLARLALNGIERGLVASRRTTSIPPSP